MALRSGRDPSAPLEALRLYSLLETRSEAATVVADAERVNAFVANLSSGLTESLANPGRLHGVQTQAMFQSMIVGLGGINLIKEEDVGEFFFDDADGHVRLPDFRLVPRDGQHLLVEVKVVAPKNVRGPHRLRAVDVAALRHYAELTGARLLLAHYWSAWNLWTLADSAAFNVRDGKLIVDMETAMLASELGLLGDAIIATVPPLTFSILADESAPQQITPSDSADETEIAFRIGGVELSAGGQVLTDDIELRIAWFLIQFGGWKLTKHVSLNSDGLRRIDLAHAPEEPAPGQPFQTVGPLSSMYSAMFRLATQTEDGRVLGMRHDVTPGILTELIPSDYFDRSDRALRLWRFNLQPPTDPTSKAAGT